MNDCKGRDGNGQPCGLGSFWSSGLCYFHEKVRDGLLTDYYVSKNARSEFEFEPIRSTPRPGGGQ